MRLDMDLSQVALASLIIVVGMYDQERLNKVKRYDPLRFTQKGIHVKE